MSDDTETTFPSTTFAVEFNGCGAMKPDFKGDVKFSVDDLPRVLTQMHDLHCKKGALTFVSDQAQIPIGSLDREWAEMTLLDGDASELVYEPICIGARCPVFAVHSSGEFEGRYVCEDGANMEAFMEVVHGETHCPRSAASDVDDEGVDELPAEDENTSTLPTCDTLTVKELAEEFGALVIAAGDVDEMNQEDSARYNVLSDELTARGRNPQDWRRIAEDDAA